MAKRKEEFTEVSATLRLTIPKTSEKTAKKLMDEALCYIEEELRNSDGIFESFDETFSGEDEDKGFCLSFDKKFGIENFTHKS